MELPVDHPAYANCCKATPCNQSELIETLSPEDVRTRNQLIDCERRMAKLAKNFLELGDYKSCSECAMRADALKWMGAAFLRGA